MTSNNNSTSQGKSRGKFTVVIAVIAALAVLGLLLSRLDGRIAIVASDAPAPTEPANTAVTAVSQPTAVVEPSPTLAPQAEGEKLEICEDDICIISSKGSSTPLGLAADYQIYPGFGFSPDGSKIVFNACLKTELQENPAYEFCHEFFIADRNGNVFRLTNTYNLPESHPSWSPDGKWIVGGGWSLSIIRPDGTGLTTLISDTAVGNAHASAWSPNSEQIAFISGDHDFNINWGFQNEVSIINKDGSGWRKIFELPEPKPIQEDWITEIAWSPDGQSLAIAFHDGRAYSIDVNCEAGKEGCRLSDLNAIPEIPQNWLDTFSPQWNGASQNTSASTLSPQAEQARAFAEPILQAVADRLPDVEDDFSFDNGNWDLGFGENPAQITEDVLRLSAADATSDEWVGARHEAMSADDFVFQFDARVTAMEFDSHLSILWRWLPSDNKAYRLILFPSLDGSWAVDNAEFQIAAGNSDAVALNKWFTVTIIGRDSRFAVLLNGRTLFYFEDSKRPIGRTVLGMNIFTGDATAEFDNVKYWNLDNVQGLP